MDDKTGAASLWMVLIRTGDADASKGSSDKAKDPFMMKEIGRIRGQFVVHSVVNDDEGEGVVDGGKRLGR